MPRPRFSPPLPRRDWSHLDDDELCRSLDTLEHAVPRAAAWECLHRLDRLAPRFEALCKDPESWHRFDCGRWEAFHAWLVLAQSGREEFSGALFRGAFYLIPLDVYRRVSGSGDHIMAAFPSGFLDILSEAAVDVRRDTGFLNCATVILGIALVGRPDRRPERAETLLRIFRSAGIDERTRSLALGFLAECGDPAVLENLLDGPECPGFSRDQIEIRIEDRRDPKFASFGPLEPFEFYREREQRVCAALIRSHRDQMKREIRMAEQEPLDEAAKRTLNRYEEQVAAEPGRCAGFLNMAIALLRCETAFRIRLPDCGQEELEWLLHRFVYLRADFEGPLGVDFWQAIERFLRFLSADRGPGPKPGPPWEKVVADLSRRYGSRPGF
ncbi:MAG: hypothetical protein FD180_3787 [Planctomycetota bacterium]|nr:MAG: hypothetical protein FD180_3787 [Planctomycetota bacterium]